MEKVRKNARRPPFCSPTCACQGSPWRMQIRKIDGRSPPPSLGGRARMHVETPDSSAPHRQPRSPSSCPATRPAELISFRYQAARPGHPREDHDAPESSDTRSVTPTPTARTGYRSHEQGGRPSPLRPRSQPTAPESCLLFGLPSAVAACGMAGSGGSQRRCSPPSRRCCATAHRSQPARSPSGLAHRFLRLPVGHPPHGSHHIDHGR
jgi:hypothetical protein